MQLLESTNSKSKMRFITLFWFILINVIVLGPVPVNPHTKAEMLGTIFSFLF